MSKLDDRDSMAMFLYEEHRVERYIGSGHNIKEYLPMWHELDPDGQHPWKMKAARLQDHLAMCRRLARIS